MNNEEIEFSVIRGKLPDGSITYARIPIINRYPLPDENTHPIQGLFLYLRYLNFSLNYEIDDKKRQHLEEISAKALDLFRNFEVVETEWTEPPTEPNNRAKLLDQDKARRSMNG